MNQPPFLYPLLITAGVVVFGLAFFLWKKNPTPGLENPADKPIYLEIGSTKVMIEIASTAKARSEGLGGRTELAAETGMLFVFEEPDRYPFWMKGVNLPLDIIWISEGWQIIGLDENVLPSSYPATFKPPQPVLYVLEVNSGFVAEQGITTGSPVRLIEGE